MIDSQSLIEITIRAPAMTVKFANFLGAPGMAVLLYMHLKLMTAEELAGKDDSACFANLLEMAYLSDCVSSFIDAKIELEKEAELINTMAMGAAA